MLVNHFYRNEGRAESLDAKKQLKRSVSYLATSVLVMSIGIANALEQYHRDASLDVVALAIAVLGLASALFVKRRVHHMIDGIFSPAKGARHFRGGSGVDWNAEQRTQRRPEALLLQA